MLVFVRIDPPHALQRSFLRGWSAALAARSYADTLAPDPMIHLTAHST